MKAPIHRRGLLAAAAVTPLIASRPARSQAPAPGAPEPKGPAVWLDLDQAALDRAYDQSAYAPNQAQVLKRYAASSDAARRRLGEGRKIHYGPAWTDRIEFYATERPNAPLHIFVHGGAWRSGLAKEYVFLAEMFVKAGSHFAAIDFSTVVELGGDLTGLADEVRRAIAHLHRQAKALGVDPGRIYLSGHSSGAHLAAVALTSDWRALGLPAEPIKGGLLCSGIYDLKPVRLSARSRYVKFTDAMEQSLSPQRHLARLATPLVVAYGSLETPEFQRQARDFAAAVGAAGKPVELVAAEHYNHFEILETLANPYGLLGRAALVQMKLA